MLHQQYRQPVIVTRKARVWPEIPKEMVALPAPPNPPNAPMPTMLITSLFSIVGIVAIELVISRSGSSGINSLPFVALSSIMGLGSLISFVVQLVIARRKTRYLLRAYRRRLEEIEKHLQALQWKERQACIDLNPPFVLLSDAHPAYEQLTFLPLIQRTLNDQDVGLWARRQLDPDFLTVRIGMGSRPATFKMRGTSLENRIAVPNKLDICNEYARSLAEQYESIVVPVTLKLDTLSPVTIIGSQQRLMRARELMHVIVSQLVYHHSPEDVRIIVLAPQSQEVAWQWATILPHTIVYDPRQSNENTDETLDTHAVAIGTEAVTDQLPLISRELGRRELLLGDARQPNKTALLPQLIIVVDHFDALNDLDQPTVNLPAVSPGQGSANVWHRARLSVSPLKRPELTLAMSRNTLLGVSVLCVCADMADVPTTSGVIIDLDAATTPQGMATVPTSGGFQALIRTLQPDPPPTQTCDLLDSAPLEALRYFALQMQPLRAASTKRLELRTQVDLRALFEPALDPGLYDPQARWRDPSFRMSHPTKGEVPRMRIPVGLKVGDEVQYLDLIKDGPHGLLIGQTGSGKSELLQTIITSLAVAYRPTEVNFLLIDYKAGLALEPFRRLPHTVGFLSNASSPALIQRFITMLKAEALRREVRMKTEKTLPRLIIIIDEFAEMAKRTESVLEELFTITRVGREIGMHLLLAAQRPEGIIGSKVRDYVQYRLCLRCASPEDSREVLRRVDAANLPASIPGRGYLLHGDNQLDLFQAARVAIAITTHSQNRLMSFSANSTPVAPKVSMLAEIIVAKIAATYSQEDAKKEGILFWPDPLPTPVQGQSPDPLTLFCTDDEYDAAFEIADASIEYMHEEAGQKRIAVVPLTVYEAANMRGKHSRPSMQIPLGLIDKPEKQQREPFLVDLHGSTGALSGGPLLIAGAQHSGKATALETMLFWLTTRYTPQQLRCAIIDPLQELDFFADLPHVQLSNGSSLWTDGSTDEKVTKLAEQITTIITKRREDPSVPRWNERTLSELWEKGVEIPQILLIISHYHSFADRLNATTALKKLALSAMEARAQGVYLVITSAEIGNRYVPADLMGKFSTKVGLFLNEQQRFDLFGRVPVVPEPLPGRGLAMTPDRQVHQVQLALPIAGASESQRHENLKQQLSLLQSQS